MQHRMKKHQLTKEQINELLKRVQTGTLATLNPDGTPYTIPMHFVYFNEAIFLHGLPKGKKIDNIIHSSKVCFSAYEMDKLLLDSNEQPCDTNTKYESVIISGNAKILDDINEKSTALKKVVEKYTPHLVEIELPQNMVKGTAVIRIDIAEISGKYYS